MRFLLSCCFLLFVVVINEAGTILDLEPESDKQIDAAADEFVCPQEHGLFSNPRSCSSFYQCYKSIAHYFNCPADTYFNPVKGHCDHQANTPCFNWRKKRIYFFSNRTSWADGDSFCKSIHQELVSIQNYNEDINLQTIIRDYQRTFKPEVRQYWTAGVRISASAPATRAFQWSTSGETFCENDKNKVCTQRYTNWCQGPARCWPDTKSKKCLQLNSDFGDSWWNAGDCEYPKYAICESIRAPPDV